MTRSAVRSRLAPPAFYIFASFGSASHTDLSGRSQRRLPRRSPLGRRRATHKCIFYIFASFGSASHTDLSGRSQRRLPRRSPLGRRRATHKCIFYIFASFGSASPP